VPIRGLAKSAPHALDTLGQSGIINTSKPVETAGFKFLGFIVHSLLGPFGSILTLASSLFRPRRFTLSGRRGFFVV
jgi:hypothetical protein